MRAVDVDCNRENSPVGRAPTEGTTRRGAARQTRRMFYRKERKEHREGRAQSKTWSQKDAKSFVFHFFDPIFLTQDVFPGHLRANSCKAPASVQFFSPEGNTQTSRKFYRKERKEHGAGSRPRTSTEGNKANKVETGTGFLQEAAEVTELGRRNPRFFASFPLFASVQFFNLSAS